ncbi:MFS transporter [Modestobacter sp. I12A-02628]|uniref:MFS transporter n=1 Tax=Goekera deserti TaxID=2497753 RepID=A0A7K3WAB1_9ACTN|nr:MFS transporter [Goekera deserti]MPQ99129.1 MFS transporter [Goekera deserti]NDI47463.1 MFS transporter [Goekera deserti]NEL53274.1 MFS transporter [Goekera deserti]
MPDLTTSAPATPPWRVLAATSIGVVLTFLNTSSLDVALPSVVRHFDAGPTAAAWVLLSYMLAVTVLVLALGRLSDLLGRRRVYLTGLAVVTVASLGCALSPDVGVLIGMRVGQAIGAAAVITSTSAILADAFPAEQLPVALGLNATVAATGALIGPVAGGLLVSLGGWSAVFWPVVPLGLLALGASALTVPPSPPRRAGERFDLLGAALSLLGLGGLVVAVSSGGSLGWTDPLVLTAAGAAVVALPLFVVVQARGRHPLLDLGLLTDRARGMAYLAGFLLSVAQFAVVLLVSLFLQAQDGLSAVDAGLCVLPVAVGTVLTAPLAGRLARRFPARALSTVGLLLVAAGLLVLAVVLRPSAGVLLTVPLTMIGAGTGLFMTPNTSAILASVPAGRRGAANGVRSMLQNAGFVLSTALTLAVVTAGLEPAAREAVYSGMLSELPGAAGDAFVTGSRAALLVLGVLCLGAVAASLSRGAPQPTPRPVEVPA